MFEVGRLCLKIAGRDSNKFCVIVEELEDRYVLVDGQTRRKKVNIAHIEPTQTVLDIKAKASHEDIVAILAKEDIVVEKRGAVKVAKARLVKQKASKVKPEDKKPAKPAKKAEPKKVEATKVEAPAKPAEAKADKK
ncbi:MAG: large subunit ribosomal protein L14e [Candidatus Woesearchaeota archaeon]|jgi:large subunit ribosomal protein L14e